MAQLLLATQRNDYGVQVVGDLVLLTEMSEENDALLSQAAQYVGGKNCSRKETVELVRKLVQALEEARKPKQEPLGPYVPRFEREVPMPDRLIDRCEPTPEACGGLSDQAPVVDLPPCRVAVPRLHDSALMLGQDANRAYNRLEALALAEKIRSVAETLK